MRGGEVQAGVEQPMPGEISFDVYVNPVVPVDTGTNTYTTVA